MKDLGIQKNLFQTIDPKNPQYKNYYPLRKFFGDQLNKLNVPFIDTCCPEQTAPGKYPLRYNNGVIEYFNGTEWAAASVGGSGARFAVTGEDDIATQDRVFNLTGHSIDIQSTTGSDFLFNGGSASAFLAKTRNSSGSRLNDYSYVNLATDGEGQNYIDSYVYTSGDAKDTEIYLSAGSMYFLLDTNTEWQIDGIKTDNSAPKLLAITSGNFVKAVDVSSLVPAPTITINSITNDGTGEFGSDSTFKPSAFMIIPVKAGKTTKIDITIPFSGGSTDFRLSTKFVVTGASVSSLRANVGLDFYNVGNPAVVLHREYNHYNGDDIDATIDWDTMPGYVNGNGGTLRIQGNIFNNAGTDATLTFNWRAFAGLAAGLLFISEGAGGTYMTL